MIIKSLELLDYRNYESLKMNFDQGINILYGDNAQGKTNILEAVHMFSMGKSNRTNKNPYKKKQENIFDTFPMVMYNNEYTYM